MKKITIGLLAIGLLIATVSTAFAGTPIWATQYRHRQQQSCNAPSSHRERSQEQGRSRRHHRHHHGHRHHRQDNGRR